MPSTARPSPRRLVYLLRCSDGSLYTGITNDLPKRLKAHAAGRASKYTRSRLPVRLVYSEPQRSKSAALKREAAIMKPRRRVRRRNGDLPGVFLSLFQAAVPISTTSTSPQIAHPHALFRVGLRARL